MHLPNGSQIFVESGRAENETAFSAITNAKRPVLTVDNAGDLAKGDIVVVTNSGWAKLIDRVVRVMNVENNSVTIEGIETTDTNVFPTGSGAGSFVKITKWIEIPCVQDVGKNGGEQQYFTYQCLSDDQEQQIPTYKSAVSNTYSFAHEFDNPIYPILRKADESGAVTAMRMYVPKAKEIRLWSAVLSFNDIPNTAPNEMETVDLSASLKGRYTFLPVDIPAE